MSTIREVAADIARELRSNPAAWHQGWFSNSREGLSSPDATSWCLSGHLLRRGHQLSWPIYGVFEAAAGNRVCSWNDTPGRTVEEVIELCDRVAESA